MTDPVRPETGWTEERKAELRRRWEAEESFAVIAAAMGVSRNAALGAAWRMGLHRADVEGARRRGGAAGGRLLAEKLRAAREDRRAALVAIRATHNPLGHKGIGRKLGRYEGPPTPEAAPFRGREAPWDPARARGVLEVGGRCRWPVAEDPDVIGGHLFCAGPRARGAYCAAHAAIAFTGETAAETIARLFNLMDPPEPERPGRFRA